MAQTLIGVTPRPNMMIGITHLADGRKVIREPKTLKVGIGYPRGKAADVFVDGDGAWNIRLGKYDSEKKLKFETVAKYPTKDEKGNPIPGARENAESTFRKAWKIADVCTYPRKVAHFLFTRPIMGDEGAEIYVPDFNAIEAHSFADPKRPGPPTEIDIVFLDDDPFTGGYAFWSASELKCSGDGENALRVLSMASTDEEKALAEEAKAAGKKHFPIVGGCWTCNCPYSKETVDPKGRTVPAPCKPGADIKFQLSRNIRVGGTAFFHTSSFRSIPQIFSSIERIKDLTGGRIAGIPLKMVVRSHKTNHNGKSAVQQNVAIEFRADDMESLRKNLIEQAWKFRQAAGLPAPARMIEAGDPLPDMEESSPMSAQAMANEFYVDAEDAEGDPVETAVPPAATATQAKQDDIGQKLKRQRESAAKKEEAPPAPQLPWVNGDGMATVLAAQKDRVGTQTFNLIVARYHSGHAKDIAFDDPKSVQIYNDLKAAPELKREEPQQSTIQDGDPF